MACGRSADADRDYITQQIVDAAESVSLRLTPPELASSPSSFRRADGSSVFRPKASIAQSSEQLLAAEDRLLIVSNDRSGPMVPLTWVEQAARKKNRDGHMLSPDQERAIAKIGVAARTSMSSSARQGRGRRPRCPRCGEREGNTTARAP
ncbi:hypothetical protein [Rathayibacter sp. VKM Ac-2801]|uniref:hypothetical protein n=1 Tax=Rathayibacter sp. VKM Ac-2801 TaxID=2609255 RepID=UPI001ABEB3AF|nr:hypothetical protein [Rathayibacter sp. VKM Ac-2801]